MDKWKAEMTEWMSEQPRRAFSYLALDRSFFMCNYQERIMGKYEKNKTARTKETKRTTKLANASIERWWQRRRRRKLANWYRITGSYSGCVCVFHSREAFFHYSELLFLLSLKKSWDLVGLFIYYIYIFFILFLLLLLKWNLTWLSFYFHLQLSQEHQIIY